MCMAQRTKSFLLAAVLVLMAWPATAGTKLSGGSVNILRDTEGAGGDLLADSSVALNNTVGEAATDSVSGGSFTLRRGYQNLEAQPGSIVSITAVTKSTGTLDLTWSAPGLDGFSGTVANGLYRIDYSTNPAHSFSQLSYQVEFPTAAVTPGTAQFYQITGLLPNTTYYTRIYLEDVARLYFAEDSSQGDESTLANAPVNPLITAVFATSVTITWNLPAGGAEDFESDASLLPAGAVIASTTASGVQVSMTLGGLNPSTTYFFKVASLNWQGDKNYATVLGTVTLPGIGPITNLASYPSALNRNVSFTWTNPSFPGFDGVLVVVSTNNPSVLPPPVVQGTSYAVGTQFSDGSVVKSTTLATGFTDTGLSLDTLYWFNFYAQGANSAYSVSVSTSVFLDLPPMAPNALKIMPVSATTNILTWRGTSSNLDGTPFISTAAINPNELVLYDIYRATQSANPGFVLIGTVPLTATVYIDGTVPDPTKTWVYKVVPRDLYAPTDAAMGLDTQGNLYVYSPDETTQLKVPPSLIAQMRVSSSPYGADILIREKDLADGSDPRIMRNAEFDAYKIPGNERVPDFHFPTPATTVSLGYAVSGGQIVPSAGGVSPLLASNARPAGLPAADAANSLGMFWDANSNFIKLYGYVDPLQQTVAVRTPNLGNYQVRALARSQNFDFDVSNLYGKVLAPNSTNNRAVFQLQNPKYSAFSGKIYDVRAKYVSDMAVCTDFTSWGSDCLQWDGRSNGQVVPGGVYIYQIRAEGKVFNGTLLVIR